MAHLARTAGLLLGASCGGLGQSASVSAPVASSLDSPGAAAFSLATPPSHARRLPAPPPGCRPLNARAMPHPSVVHGWVPPEVRTTTVVAGDRLVVFQTADGAPERGEMFDPATDAWIPTASADAPRYGSFKEGSGPLGVPQYFGFEDWVVVVWFDGNHGKQFSGAVFDARRNAWHAMSTAGMPQQDLEPAYEAGTAGVYVRLRREGADSGYRYDVRADRWSAIPSAGGVREVPAIAASGGKVAVWGGIVGEARGTGAVLDLATNSWRPMSTAGAPRGREVAWSAARDGVLVTWSGRSARTGAPDLPDGGVYDIATDRWTPVPAAGAPDPKMNVDPVFLSWTGEAIVDREMPPSATSNAEPRRLAIWDPALGRWWRSRVATTWPVLPLGFGRVLVAEGSPRVVHAREQLDCPAVLALPIFERGPNAFTATALIGDELVVWGAVDSTVPPPCPAGAPCARFKPVFTPVDEGAVVSP